MLVGLAAAFSASAQSTTPVKIEIENGILSVQGNPVSPDWKTQTLTGTLPGTPRISKKANMLYSYDEYGLVIFEDLSNDGASGNINEVQVHFAGTGDTVTTKPKNAFKGDIIIEGLKVNAATGLDVLKPKLRGYVQSAGFMPNMYKFAKGSFYFYFLFD